MDTFALSKDVGMNVSALGDIFVSYDAPTLSTTKDEEDWLIFNPSVFLEASGDVSVTFKLIFIHLTLSLNLVGYKFAPIDAHVGWSLDKKSRICSSVGYL